MHNTANVLNATEQIGHCKMIHFTLCEFYLYKLLSKKLMTGLKTVPPLWKTVWHFWAKMEDARARTSSPTLLAGPRETQAHALRGPGPRVFTAQN